MWIIIIVTTTIINKRLNNGKKNWNPQPVIHNGCLTLILALEPKQQYSIDHSFQIK